MKRLIFVLVLLDYGFPLGADRRGRAGDAGRADVRVLVDGGSASTSQRLRARSATAWSGRAAAARPRRRWPSSRCSKRADAKGLDAADYDGGHWAARIANLQTTPRWRASTSPSPAPSLHYASRPPHRPREPARGAASISTRDAKTLYAPALVAQRRARRRRRPPRSRRIEPQHDDYRRLLAALATYRRIAADRSDDAPLPVVAKLVAGRRLRRAAAARGDASASTATSLRRAGRRHEVRRRDRRRGEALPVAPRPRRRRRHRQDAPSRS